MRGMPMKQNFRLGSPRQRQSGFPASKQGAWTATDLACKNLWDLLSGILQVNDSLKTRRDGVVTDLFLAGDAEG